MLKDLKMLLKLQKGIIYGPLNSRRLSSQRPLSHSKRRIGPDKDSGPRGRNFCRDLLGCYLFSIFS